MQLIYTTEQNITWQELLAKRKQCLPDQACKLYLHGLSRLQLPSTYIPSCFEINETLKKYSEWRMVPTTELITAVNYFKMLANFQFPAITSIRPRHEIDYYTSDKPDVVHEFLGHGPFLTDPDFSNFIQQLSAIATTYSPQEQILLGRLFWFTIEFGLINTEEGLRVYGAGLIPSASETEYALKNADVERREFNIVDVLRTKFSATKKQDIYYVIPNFETLYALLDTDLSHYIYKAMKLGKFYQPSQMSQSK